MAKKSGKKLDHNKDDRKFVLLLYEESTSYNFEEVLSAACDYAEEWSYIRHDKDVEDDELKKPHYHVALKFKSARTRKAISKKIGLPENYIERALTWKSANEYHIHLNEEDKYPYDMHDVVASFDYIGMVYKESEEEKVDEILEYVIQTRCTSFIALSKWCVANHKWSEYRRNYAIISGVVNEIISQEVAKKEKEKQERNMNNGYYQEL